MEKKPKVIVFDLGTGKIVNVMFNFNVSQIYNNHIMTVIQNVIILEKQKIRN
jgi:hypothetical protein